MEISNKSQKNLQQVEHFSGFIKIFSLGVGVLQVGKNAMKLKLEIVSVLFIGLQIFMIYLAPCEAGKARLCTYVLMDLNEL